MRKSSGNRNTKETKINYMLNLDGTGTSVVDTGIGFFNHMLEALAKHSLMDITLHCEGDLEVDTHHTVEDCGIVLGQALKEALGSKQGIERYASFTMPMDDALVLCSIDLSGRAYFQMDYDFEIEQIGTFETQTVHEFFQSFASSAGMNLHFLVVRGENAHHIVEAMFKGLARCLREAVTVNPGIQGSLSTKGVL